MKSLTPARIAWTRFKKHKFAMASLIVLAFLLVLSLFVPWVSGHDVDKSNIMKIFVPPSKEHILGTDENGYDVFTRLFYGGRISLGIGILASFCAAFIGILIGAVSGYFEGLVDAFLMRFTDIMLSLPVLPLLIILSALDYNKLSFAFFDFSFVTDSPLGALFRIIVIIALFSWMSVARLVRAEVLSHKQKDFIFASKSLGAGNLRIILYHLIPNSLTSAIIATTLSLGSIIQYEAVLSFLGLGVPITIPSWGSMLSNSLEYFIKAPELIFYPGLLISITVVCINFIGDGLRDALDPKQIIKR